MTKLKNVKMPSRCQDRHNVDNSEVTLGYIWRHMNHGKSSLQIESERDALFAFRVTCVNIVRTIVTAPIEPLSQVISALVRIDHELARIPKLQAQRRATQRLIRRRTIERAQWNADGWIGWDAPIYGVPQNGPKGA